MELMAVIAAVGTLEGGKSAAQAVLYSDSRYVVDAVTKGWAVRWRANNWMRDATNQAENADLWEELLELLRMRKVEFRWVRGHASHPENERCDYLAVKAAHARLLPDDPGFSRKC
jgi:ribonuclease HI